MPALIEQITVNNAGIGELLKSAGVRAEVLRRVNAVAAAAASSTGGKRRTFKAGVVTGRVRIHGSVYWTGGLRQEIRDRTLASALDAARGD